jgi:hypothetical protein
MTARCEETGTLRRRYGHHAEMVTMAARCHCGLPRQIPCREGNLTDLVSPPVHGIATEANMHFPDASAEKRVDWSIFRGEAEMT